MTTPTGPALVLIDHHAGAVRPPALELLTLARAIGDVCVLWFGDGLDGALPLLAEYGVRSAYQMVIDAPVADVVHLPAVAAEAIAAAVRQSDAVLVLLSSTFENKEIGVLLAREIDAGIVVDANGVTLVDGAVETTQSVFSSTWNVRTQITTPRAVVAIKPNSITAEPAPVSALPSVIGVAVAPSDEALRTRIVERSERVATGRPELAEAQVVVAGGRGTNGDFSAIEELADLLGAAIGATRVATDQGWIDRTAQIGQTGVTIAPQLYIGAGLSGAVHHTGGMQSSGTIIAINGDPEAPIFEIADFGIVGDLFSVLPQLSAELRGYLGSRA
jgi:electron transfer flavoprotein alpha subunit